MIRWISAPLDVEGWEVVESLEDYALYPEYAARIDECLQLIADGQAFWQPYRNATTIDDDGSWQPGVEHAISEVRRLAYNIRQLAERYGGDLAGHIRSSIYAQRDDISDSAYVAAMGIDRACWAIQRISRWLVEFEAELVSDWGPYLKATLAERPDLYEKRINQTRCDCAISEGETMESVAEFTGAARRYIEQAGYMQLAQSATTRRAQRAGQASGESRREQTQKRDTAICSEGRRLLKSGRSTRDLAGMIAKTAIAEGLTVRRVRDILKDGGVT